MTHDTQSVRPCARLSGQNRQGDCDGGTLPSDGGVLLLHETEAQVGSMRRCVEALEDRRAPRDTAPRSEELWRPRILQSRCGAEEANDCQTLRRAPACKAACERLPSGGEARARPPTMGRLDHAPRRTEWQRRAWALRETFVASYARAPQAMRLDRDETAEEVPGRRNRRCAMGMMRPLALCLAIRTSGHQVEAPQVRVLLPSAAYGLMHPLRTQGLRGPAWGKAPWEQIPLRLFQVGARVAEWKTQGKLHFPRALPWKEGSQTVLGNVARTERCGSPASICRIV